MVLRAHMNFCRIYENGLGPQLKSLKVLLDLFVINLVGARGFFASWSSTSLWRQCRPCPCRPAAVALPCIHEAGPPAAQIQIRSTFGQYFDIQYKYIEDTKRKTLCTYSKIQIFFTLQTAQYFDLIRTNFPHLWIQNQNNFSNFN